MTAPDASTEAPAVRGPARLPLPAILLSFEGRIGRLDYWLCYVFASVVTNGAWAIDLALNRRPGPLAWSLTFLAFWPLLAIAVKRCHDRGRSGWFLLANLIPVVGPIWYVVEVGFLPGRPGGERFDPPQGGQRGTDRSLLVLVTLTGASVLVLEVLGTRVIGTHYGSSLYVWAALITVTLVCLAVGYAIGGLLADRLPRAWALYVLVALAGGSVLLVPWMTGLLGPLGDRLGLAGGAIASAAVLFFLPLTLLAMAGPYVIRLRARSVAAMGSTSGAVYAVSTAGSVAGALGVSLWLIPTLGTRQSLLLCSGVLIGLGAMGLVRVFGGRALAAAALIAVPLLVPAREPPVPGELYHTESAFGDLRVVQRGDRGGRLHRMLMVNGIMQTGMPLDIDLVGPGAILQTDNYYLELLPYFYSDLAAGRRGVLIGLAGGMFPRVMEFYDIDWTAVEIDAKLAELAKAYFGYRGEIRDAFGFVLPVDLSRFPDRASPVMAEHLAEAAPEHAAEHAPSGPYRGRAVIQDGRKFLADHAGKVDFIVVDAYNSDTIPFHLITREFFELVRSRLTGDGLMAINYIGRPSDDFVTDSLFRTLGAVFGRDRLLAYRTGEGESAVQVIIIYAFRGRPRELLPLWQLDAMGGADRLSYELSRRRVATDRPDGAIITDDHNPIDLARAQTALQWRRETMALFGGEGTGTGGPAGDSARP